MAPATPSSPPVVLQRAAAVACLWFRASMRAMIMMLMSMLLMSMLLMRNARFWFRYVYPNRSALEAGGSRQVLRLA